jgi:hypothetical protein
MSQGRECACTVQVFLYVFIRHIFFNYVAICMKGGRYMNGSPCKAIPVECLAHYSGRTLVNAEYGYPIFKHQQLQKKSAATAINTALASAHTQTA